jgi:IS30 family transposase
MYKQLSLEQRYQIAALKKSGFGINKIAGELYISAATVSRELKRNGLVNDSYDAAFAHRLAQNRKKQKIHYRKFSIAMRQLAEQKLQAKWSPEQIAGRCKLEGTPMVSTETLYRYIWQNKAGGGILYTHLRHRCKNYRKRYGCKSATGCIPGRVSIDHRPAVVDEKSREGDWEIDTIIGANRKGAVLTSVERKTQFSLLAKINSKSYKQVQKTLINMFAPYKDQVLTITSDNGFEFRGHQYIAKKLQADYYFAHPYSSWERGLNEYHNKLIRQYIPKKSSLDDYDYLKILNIQKQLNQRPRKKLNYRTPNEVFLKYTVALTG